MSSPKESSAEQAAKAHKKTLALNAVMHQMFMNARETRDVDQAKAAVKLGSVLGKYVPNSKLGKKLLDTRYVLKPLKKEIGFHWALAFPPSPKVGSVQWASAAFLPGNDGVVAYNPGLVKMVIRKAEESASAIEFPVRKSVYFYELSPDGLYLATMEGFFDFNVYDARSGKLIFHERVSIFEFTSMAFSPDSKHVLLTRKSKGIYMWSVATRSWVRENLMNPAWRVDRVNLIRFSPDGAQVAFLSLGNFIEVLSFPAFERTRALECWSIHDMCFSPDSKRLVFVEEREEAVLPEDEATEACTYMYACSVQLARSTPTSPKATLLTRIAIGRGHLGPFYTGDITVRLSPDACKVAVQSIAGELEPVKQMPAPSFTVFNVNTGRAYPRTFHPAAFKGEPVALANATPITMSLAFSADNKRLLQNVQYTVNTGGGTKTSVLVMTCYAVPR